VAALVLAAVLGLAACTGGTASPSVSSAQALPTTPASAAQQLSETGSSLMAPLFTLWGPAYHAQFSQVNISTASSSSGTGISSAAAGTTDIGASDAYLSPADVTKHTNWAVSTGTTQLAQVNFQPLPPSVVTLSQAQIAKIKG
jgi:phosphate transport system substrate-binding protein